MVDQFCFPSGKLSNELVELTPFSLPTHARDLYERSKDHPELYAQYPQGPYDNYESFIASFACGLLAQNNETLAFTIIDKTKNFLAGVTAFVDADPVGRSVTIGTLFILPPYQRTHIATNTIGLMLQYALTPHSDGGLGLIQVKWRLCSLHKGYARVAERMGFKYEGTERWFRLIKNGVARGKVGNGRSPPPSSEEGDVWQDRTTNSMCWDDWVGGSRLSTLAAMMVDADGGVIIAPFDGRIVQLHGCRTV